MSKFVLALAAAGLVGASAAQLSHQNQTFPKEAAQGNQAGRIGRLGRRATARA